jgi:hypothetical protein
VAQSRVDAEHETRKRDLEYLISLATEMRGLLSGMRPPARVESRMREYKEKLNLVKDVDGLIELYEAAFKLMIATEARYDKDRNTITILANTLREIEAVIAAEQAGYNKKKPPILVVYEALVAEGHTEPTVQKWHQATLDRAGKTEKDRGWGERTFRRAIGMS